MNRDVAEREIRIPGFRFAGVACGVKASGAPDCGLIACDAPATAGAVFTRNRFAAAPVVVGRDRLRRGRLQAIVVNSGNANACTGRVGLADARQSCAVAASALGIEPELVAPASTGIIGEHLPMERLVTGIRDAVGSAAPDGIWRFAHAIMTTDVFPKVASQSVRLGKVRATIAAVGKGAGMMAPNMATLLVFLMTDAALGRAEARHATREVADLSFNALIVDGDTSTNDSMFLLAGGAAGNLPLGVASQGYRAWVRAASEVAVEIARQIAADGEGATKLVTIEVRGAATREQARRVARTVAGSVLVKTAFFGADPNWGRVACAIGNSGIAVPIERVQIRIGEVDVFRSGQGVDGARDRAREIMRGNEFTVGIALGMGRERARVFTSDLSHAYVELNSAYST